MITMYRNAFLRRYVLGLVAMSVCLSVGIPTVNATQICDCTTYVKSVTGVEGSGDAHTWNDWPDGLLRQNDYYRVFYPQVGDIVVFEAGDIGPKGHVGIYQETKFNGSIFVRGANQEKLTPHEPEAGCSNVNTIPIKPNGFSYWRAPKE